MCIRDRGRITATGSLVYTNVTEHVKIGDAPADFQRLAPSFTVSLQPWQEQLLFLRLMYKSTFRMPTFNDLSLIHILEQRTDNAEDITIATALTPKQTLNSMGERP